MIIVGGNLVTWEKPNRILTGYGLRIEGGKISEMGPEADLLALYPQEERLDARGQYVMPGNICAHTHFYGAFARGMAIPGSAPDGFPKILEKLWWPLYKSLTLEDVRYSALVCLVDAIRHGTTTLIDHHASPLAIAGSLDEIAQAVQLAGLRASLCYEVTDRNGTSGALAGIKENVRFINSIHASQSGGMLGALFGLHASLTLSEETLEACRQACPEDVGFHIHVAEHPVDEYDSLEIYGMRVIDRLEKHGILGPRSIIVHAVHVDQREVDLIAHSQSWVSHQPRSNMNNAVGLPAVEGMMRAGIKVCLGNDGFSNAMWEEWKTAYLAHKLLHGDPRRMSGTSVVEMAIYNNADLAQQQLNTAPLGILMPGAEADLILVDYHPFTEVTADNLPWHILFGFNESMITTSMVHGKLLMKDRELLTLDEEKIAHEARRLSGQVAALFKTICSIGGRMSEETQSTIQTIGIIGGTGKEGKGLAYRWARAGYQILIGSRTPEKASAAAEEVNILLGKPDQVKGLANLSAAQNADLVVMTVPFAVHKEMLEAIKPQVQGKIVIDVTVPLVPPKVTKVQMPAAGSAAQEAQQILGEGVQVVSAFQNISYEHLLHDEAVDCDVLVCGSGKAARVAVLGLVKAAGLIGWDAGPLENSVVVEGLTSILIGLNKQFGVLSSGIRITGISRE